VKLSRLNALIRQRFFQGIDLGQFFATKVIGFVLCDR
jgi:hypothetical protein